MIYLDYAAISKPRKEIIDTVVDTMCNHWYNASTIYENGIKSKQIVEHARILIANEINCEPEEIIFTSSGTEANTLAFNAYESFITGVLEHSSILMNPKARVLIHCDSNGKYLLDDINKFSNTCISLMHTNNEIGVIQDISKISDIIHKNKSIYHVDATQAFGHIRIDVKQLNIDMLSCAGQKISGIPGCGFLYVKKELKDQIKPIFYGHQEDGFRAGTYNVLAIAAFSKAIELIDYSKTKYVEILRKYCWDELCNVANKHNTKFILNGDGTNRLANNLNFQIPCLDNQQIVALMDLNGICVSAASACQSYESTPSHVLKAIGLSDAECDASIRVTLSEDTTKDEIDRFVKQIDIMLEQFLEE